MYLIIYAWGVVVNFALTIILILLSGEIKNKVFKKNLNTVQKFTNEEPKFVDFNNSLFFIPNFASWIFTSFLCILIFIKIMGRKITPFDELYENCLWCFSKKELEESDAFIVYFLMKNRDVLYSRNKAFDYIFNMSKAKNYPIQSNQVDNVFNSLGL